MSIDNILYEAIDVLKERVSALETHLVQDRDEESKEVLKEVRRILSESKGIKTNIVKLDENLKKRLAIIEKAHEDLRVTLQQFADYFDMRRQLNLRIDRTQRATEVSEKIKTILLDFARDTGEDNEHEDRQKG